jgi:ribonuclease R
MGKSPIRGIIYFSRTGRAKVHPDKGQPISLARGASGTSLHGDLVELYRLPPKKKERNRSKERPPRFEVRKIIRRETDEFLGFFSTEIGRPVITSENPRIPIPFKILGEVKEINEQDKVLVKFVRWDPPARIPTCKIIRVIGPGGDALTDHKGILAKYGLSPSFPSNVEKEAISFGKQVTSEDLEGRKDLRDVLTITIDPLDARDFDDAISLRTLENGEMEIGVHIADVSHYVRSGTALDQEARKRANSTYLVGEVVPMLPHSLSSGLCSLIEAEDRLVKSVSFRFASSGDLLGHQISESVIRSDKRLTYEQALLFLQKDNLEDILKASPPPSRYSGNPGKPLEKVDRDLLQEIYSMLRSLGFIASKLRKKRMVNGSLELASSEVKILVDERGHPEKIYQNKDDESHQLIEEFMLLANQTIARQARKKRLSVVYRTHPDPDPENLDELRHFLSLFGISCGDLSSRKEVQKMLHQINKSPISQVLRIKFLRSLQQACYRATPDGHYGLAMKDYLHFTSPIRRYADLVTHRAIESTLSNKKTKEKPSGFLVGLAKKLSISERISVDAERESTKDKLLLYYQKDLESKKPVRRKALVTELNRKGLFVELTETLARGFIPIRTLPRELGYRLASNGAFLVGRNPKNKLRIGQEVDVQIDRINTLEKQMDFRLA